MREACGQGAALGVHVQAHVRVGHAVLGHADALQALQSRTTHPTAHRRALVMGCGSQIWAQHGLLPHPSWLPRARRCFRAVHERLCSQPVAVLLRTGTQRSFLLLTLFALRVHACAGCLARLPHPGSVGGSRHSGPDVLQRASSVKQLHAQQALQPDPHPCLHSCSHIERWSDPREHAGGASSNSCNSLTNPTYSDGPFTATSAPWRWWGRWSPQGCRMCRRRRQRSLLWRWGAMANAMAAWAKVAGS